MRYEKLICDVCQKQCADLYVISDTMGMPSNVKDMCKKCKDYSV